MLVQSRSLCRLVVWSLVCFFLFSGPAYLFAAQDDLAVPTKADLIKTLDAILPLLQAEDYEGAAKHVVMPPTMNPNKLSGILRANEISLSGIRQLDTEATFATAIELFGEDRAASIAGRFDSDVKKCYGFKHKAGDVTAEVVGLWDGTHFKLVRIDDVGKLEGTKSTEMVEAEESEIAPTREPTKFDLIKALDTVLPMLQAENYEAAAPYFMMPPNMNPNKLSGILKANELSEAGIRQLEKEAKFGTAIEHFGEERAKAFASRMQANVDQCFGFEHENGDVIAEVVAQWDGIRFKFVRIDDVGKLSTDLPNVQPMKESESPTKNDSTNEVPDAPSLTREETIRNTAQLLPGLLATVEANPNDVPARAKLAMAYFQIGNTPAAWGQLMKAEQMEPSHEGIDRGIDTLINAFTKQGVFTVGVPTETIQSLLGEPGQKLDLGKRVRWVYSHWGVDFTEGRVGSVIDLRGATEELFNPTERVITDLGGQTWLVGFRRNSKDRSTTFYFVPGETISSHSQKVTVERVLNGATSRDMKAISEFVIKQERDLIPGIMHKVLKSSGDSVIIAAKIPGTEESPAQHQLTRLMKGPLDLHRITYTLISKDDPTGETQQDWLAIFEAAKLEKIQK